LTTPHHKTHKKQEDEVLKRRGSKIMIRTQIIYKKSIGNFAYMTKLVNFAVDRFHAAGTDFYKRPDRRAHTEILS
jgi:hypothetical protein